MSNLITGRGRLALKKFRSHYRRGHSGVIRPGFPVKLVDRIVEQFKDEHKGPRDGWRVGNYFVKVCGKDEMGDYPPARFTNALSIEGAGTGGMPYLVPDAQALIQIGGLKEVALDQANMLYVADFFEGNTLRQHLNNDDLEPSTRKLLLDLLFVNVGTYRYEKNIFLMDFAPRDVVAIPRDLRGKTVYYPIIVDTEHVEFGDCETLDKLRQQQIEQFIEDYKHFLSGEEMKSGLKYFRRVRR
jgi:hypothetical protein